MDERRHEVLVYAPSVLLVVYILVGILILAGPSLGGMFGTVHSALRDMLAGDARVLVDETEPLSVSRAGGVQRASLPPIADTTIAQMLALPPVPTPTPGIPCAAFHFDASIGIGRGRASFGRFNLVSDTDPYGASDPLASWKVIQFGGFSIDARSFDKGRSVTIPVGETVNVLISDPFTKEMLLSAKWLIKEVDVRGRRASINADLETNLSDVRVNNAVDSGTLLSFSTDTMGALTMSFEHVRDIGPALKAGEPIYSSVRGTVHSEHCIR